MVQDVHRVLKQSVHLGGFEGLKDVSQVKKAGPDIKCSDYIYKSHSITSKKQEDILKEDNVGFGDMA